MHVGYVLTFRAANDHDRVLLQIIPAVGDFQAVFRVAQLSLDGYPDVRVVATLKRVIELDDVFHSDARFTVSNITRQVPV